MKNSLNNEYSSNLETVHENKNQVVDDKLFESLENSNFKNHISGMGSLANRKGILDTENNSYYKNEEEHTRPIPIYQEPTYRENIKNLSSVPSIILVNDTQYQSDYMSNGLQHDLMRTVSKCS